MYRYCKKFIVSQNIMKSKSIRRCMSKMSGGSSPTADHIVQEQLKKFYDDILILLTIM